MKKSIICSLVAVTVALFSTVAFAATNLSDIGGHWAESSIKRWVDAEVIVEDGEYNPDDFATRGEVADKLVRILKLEDKADLSNYQDIKVGDKHYDAISKAVKAGLMEGDSPTQIRVSANISRQELVLMLNRMYKMKGLDTEKLEMFADAAEVAPWAKDAVNAFTYFEYMNGYLDNTIRPEGFISKAEVDKLLDFSIGMIITESGTYDVKDVKGNIIVLAKRVTLKNAENVDNICAVSTAVAKTLKVNGVLNSDEVATIVESTSSSLGGGLAGGSSSGGGSTGGSSSSNTTARVEIATSGDEYDFTSIGSVESADKIVVNVGTGDITIKNDATLRANVDEIFVALTETDADLDMALTTLANNFDNNEYVMDWGIATIRAMGEPYQAAVLEELFADGTDDTIDTIYDALVEAGNQKGVSEADVRKLIKEKALAELENVLPTFDEVRAFLSTL